MEIDDTNDTKGDTNKTTVPSKDAETPTPPAVAVAVAAEAEEGTTAEPGEIESIPPTGPTTPSIPTPTPTEGEKPGATTETSPTATITASKPPSSGDDVAASAEPSPPKEEEQPATSMDTEVSASAVVPKTVPSPENGRVVSSSSSTTSTASPKSTSPASASKSKPSSVGSGAPSSKTTKPASASSSSNNNSISSSSSSNSNNNNKNNNNKNNNPKPAKVKSSSSSSSSAKSSAKNGTSSNGGSNNNGATSKAATTTSNATKSLKKGARKKRKATGIEEAEEKGAEKGPVLPKKKKPKKKKEKEESEKASAKVDKSKKARKQTKKAASSASGNSGGGSHPYADHLHALPGLTADQIRDQELMRKALEEEQYSANGSIVDSDSDDDEHEYKYKGQSVRLDRVHLLQAAKKCGWLLVDVLGGTTGMVTDHDGDSTSDGYEEETILREDGTTNTGSIDIVGSISSKKKSSRNKKKGHNQYTNRNSSSSSNSNNSLNSANTKCFRIDDKPQGSKPKHGSSSDIKGGPDAERDEGSIFGQTTGASNSIWVECDKCKKWRRLRGVVDQSKLPKKWYCSMNRNDPERARCSAPEEEYDAPITPESAADARTRKHLRVWVRRLQCNEQYESRLPTLTRNQKRSVASTSKEPHEWIRCTNPSCGKWRAILRSMDAKQHVIDRTSDGEWFCVMNTWDEKTASCAAPQENLPAVGCPPWVLQDVAN